MAVATAPGNWSVAPSQTKLHHPYFFMNSARLPPIAGEWKRQANLTSVAM